MKKVYFAVIASLLLCSNLRATNVVIIESQSFNPGHTCDTQWLSVCTGLGYTAVIYPQTELDINTWFSTTDILIVSSGVIALTPSRIDTMQAFLQYGGRIYLQTEYDCGNFVTNTAYAQIVNALGGGYNWLGVTSGVLAPMNVLGSLGTTPNAISPLSYFWYGCAGAGIGCNSHVEAFLEYGGQNFGFIFCNPGNSSRMITTSDQDWVIQGTSLPLMQNIAVNLASPVYTCAVNSGGLNVSLGSDTAVCNGQPVTIDGTTATAISYLWSTSETTATITVSIAGTYWIQVSNGTCTGTDTINIGLAAPFSVNLGNDTAVCTPGTVILDATTAGGSYTWQDGSSVSTYTVTQSGTYSVTVNVSGCTSGDSIQINVNNSPVVNLGNDTSVCLPDTLILDATSAGGVYSWSNGSSNAAIRVFQTGEYAVTVSLSGCTSVDSMHLTENPKPPASISANQTVFCSGDSAQICATAGMATYNWNTGDTSSCIITQLAGNYYVTVTDVNGCSAASNHLAITVYSPPPVSVSVNGDTLSSYNAVTYQWFLNGSPIAGATSQIYIANQGGNYTVEVTDSNGCAAFSTAVVISGILTPTLSQGEGAISVYPNPNSVGSWQLTVGKELLGSVLEIFDEEGRLVVTTNIKQQTINIELNVARGVYMLRISSANDVMTRKLARL